MLDGIIISDIHLGSDNCQAENLVAFLIDINIGKISCRELIINGDITNSWDMRRLCKIQWKVLSTLRSISDHVHVVWIRGNHDGDIDNVSHMLGVDFVEEYIIRSGNKKILALHGDQFDGFIAKHPIITAIADWFYGVLQKLDCSFRLARQAKRASKTFLRNSKDVQDGAIEYAKSKNCDIVCCGHTHMETVKLGDISYYNSGCWTEQPCCYLEVKNGGVSLQHYIAS